MNSLPVYTKLHLLMNYIMKRNEKRMPGKPTIAKETDAMNGR